MRFDKNTRLAREFNIRKNASSWQTSSRTDQLGEAVMECLRIFLEDNTVMITVMK